MGADWPHGLDRAIVSQHKSSSQLLIRTQPQRFNVASQIHQCSLQQVPTLVRMVVRSRYLLSHHRDQTITTTPGHPVLRRRLPPGSMHAILLPTLPYYYSPTDTSQDLKVDAGILPHPLGAHMGISHTPLQSCSARYFRECSESHTPLECIVLSSHPVDQTSLQTFASEQ